MSTNKACSTVDAWKHMSDVQFGNVPNCDRQQTVFYFPSHPEMIQYEAERVARLISKAPEMAELLRHYHDYIPERTGLHAAIEQLFKDLEAQ